jgi:hypothetical protein
MWEIFSRGKVPYADLTAIECLKAVAAGRRLQKPSDDMPEAAFELMRACMLANETARPSMKDAASSLLSLYEEQEVEKL